MRTNHKHKCLEQMDAELLDSGPFKKKKKMGVVQPSALLFVSYNNVLKLCLSVGPDALFSF